MVHLLILSLSLDMGNGHEDGTWQVIRQQPGALNTSRMLKGLVPETDLVFHIGDISYARGYANVVSGNCMSYYMYIQYYCVILTSTHKASS